MRYTIWSNGRLVGESDLAFVRVADASRCGWFFPSEEGERVMPVATSVLTAIRRSRGAQVAEGPDIPELRGSASRADVAEAMHHVAALELELRDEHGVVIPTEDIGFQDTYALLELAREAELAMGDLGEWEMEDDPDALFGTAIDLGEDEGGGDEPDLAPSDPSSSPEHSNDGPGGASSGGGSDPAREERYQLFVTLLDPRAIP